MFAIQLILQIFVLVLFKLNVDANIQCKDENGNAVDWFYVYKLPKLTEDKYSKQSKHIKTGEAYAYITSNDKQGEWKISEQPITCPNSILGKTLNPLYGNDTENVFYVLYNSQPPNSEDTKEKGIAKGTVLGDSDGGIWLIHTVPQFPQMGDKYNYPTNEDLKFGQTFLCMSMDVYNLNKVGSQLQINEVNTYASKILPNLKYALRYLSAATIDSASDNPSRFHHVKEISTKGGAKFTTFAKGRNFNKDIYSDGVASELKTKLMAETLVEGVTDALPSSCSKKDVSVKNVKSVSIANIPFSNKDDHGIWAVSEDKNNWVCMGDIDRVEHQKNRGGGAVCFDNQKLKTAFHSLVVNVEQCPTQKKN